MPQSYGRRLLPPLVVYAAATLLHHIHNAEFLAEYPGMPVWLTRAGVYGAWLGATAVGFLGYQLLRHGHHRTGIALVALYALYGLFSLAHFALAPVSAHTYVMTFTIALEVAAGLLVLNALVSRSQTGTE